ncbi:putative phenylalanine ammonia-lyase [Triangularia verruculosa]|uniref:Phenylalanine ammonia-lyase n=1 Tax=Triangularia verruculosa TaxID=2587418 RepID=A0AAN6XVW3_9PEZI|nr:putative phenylalanine ammonia-lyase [Triangularia verruculosa]
MITNGSSHARKPDASHASGLFSEWQRLQRKLAETGEVSADGDNLTIADVVAVALNGTKAHLTSEERTLEQVEESVGYLAQELGAGHTIYGVNTGFGGSADTRTQDFERLQSAAIQHLNVGILLQSDKGNYHGRNELLRSHALPTPVIKAAMLIRCNSLMRGHSGVRVSVIESIMNLLANNMTPVVPLRGSISASGDLSTLSYIAGAIEGNPDIFIKHESKIIPANEALEIASISPVRLQAKEGLGITNGTAPSCAMASLVMDQANQLALLVQLLTAMGTEALNGTSHNYHPFISTTRPHPGQAEVASNILAFLADSKISPPFSSETLSQIKRRLGLAQDRYSLRTAPQWIGPQLEDLLLATKQVTTELNSTTDNPLIDAASGEIHHGGNFQAMVVTSAMEKTLTALQNLGRLIFAQCSEVINNMTNKGLAPNLSADDPSQSFTCKGFDVNMAAYMAELSYLARPISASVQIAEMGNQSVNSMALVAGRYAMEAVEVVALMCATYIYVLCQALDLRVIQLQFREMVRFWLPTQLKYGVFSFRDGDFGGDTEKMEESISRVAGRLGDFLLQRWDELSHLDLKDRCDKVARESVGHLLEDDEFPEKDTAIDPLFLREYRFEMSEFLQKHCTEQREVFRDAGRAGEFIGGGSRVVYEFVRKELGIPLNRGVEDHPPLLLRANGHVVGNGAEADPRSKILGTMASDIYEALRKGVLHDRIMKYGEEAGIWK